MALAPRFSHYLLRPSKDVNELSIIHTIEVFLDMVCPFSKKMFNTLANSDLQFVFRHQVQPWHPQSSYLHYSVMLVNKFNPEFLFKALQVLFESQDSFFDAQVQDLSPIQLYSRVADILNKNGIPFDIKNLSVGEGNTGSVLVPDMKYHMRFTRQLGVHTSPTVFIDGLEDSKISSSWAVDQWIQHLQSIN